MKTLQQTTRGIEFLRGIDYRVAVHTGGLVAVGADCAAVAVSGDELGERVAVVMMKQLTQALRMGATDLSGLDQFDPAAYPTASVPTNERDTSAELFLIRLAQVSPCVGVSRTYCLHKVRVEHTPGAIRLLATDARRVAEGVVPATQAGTSPHGIVGPVVAQLSRIRRPTGLLQVGDHTIRYGRICFHSRPDPALDLWPEYDQVLGRVVERSRVVLSVAELVRRADAVPDNDSPVELVRDIIVRAGYIRDAANAIRVGEYAIVGYSDPDKPITVRGIDSGATHTIQPLKRSRSPEF